MEAIGTPKLHTVKWSSCELLEQTIAKTGVEIKRFWHLCSASMAQPLLLRAGEGTLFLSCSLSLPRKVLVRLFYLLVPPFPYVYAIKT